MGIIIKGKLRMVIFLREMVFFMVLRDKLCIVVHGLMAFMMDLVLLIIC